MNGSELRSSDQKPKVSFGALQMATEEPRSGGEERRKRG